MEAGVMSTSITSEGPERSDQGEKSGGIVKLTLLLILGGGLFAAIYFTMLRQPSKMTVQREESSTVQPTEHDQPPITRPSDTADVLSEQKEKSREKEDVKSGESEGNEGIGTDLKAQLEKLGVEGSVDSEHIKTLNQGFKRFNSILSPKPIQSAFLSSVVLTAVSLMMVLGIAFAAYRLSLNPLEAETIAKIHSNATMIARVTGGIAFVIAFYVSMVLENGDAKGKILGMVCMAFVSLCALSMSARVVTDLSTSLSTLPLSSELGPMRFFDWFTVFVSENMRTLGTVAMACMFMNMVWSLMHEKMGNAGGIWLDLLSLPFALIYTWTSRSRSLLFKFFMLISVISAFKSYSNIVL